MNKKTIIWIVVILALAVAAYVLYNYFKNKREQALLNSTTNQPTTPPNVISGNGTSTGLGDVWPIQVGSKGANVTAAQTALNKAGCLYGANVVVDGSFGPITAGAADTCLKGKNGHVAGQISYVEFVYLKNKAAGTSTSGAGSAGSGSSGSALQQIAVNSCSNPSTKTWFEQMYGVKCSNYGL